jgi:hypothetical protein
MKILDFFLFQWDIFALLDPDPATQINADPCGSGSGTLCAIAADLSFQLFFIIPIVLKLVIQDLLYLDVSHIKTS